MIKLQTMGHPLPMTGIKLRKKQWENSNKINIRETFTNSKVDICTQKELKNKSSWSISNHSIFNYPVATLNSCHFLPKVLDILNLEFGF